MSWLVENCPRLARAHQTQRLIVDARSRRARKKRDQLLQLERLVEHRELQYQRAAAVGDRRYIARRHDKLQRARRMLEHVRADLAAVWSWEPRFTDNNAPASPQTIRGATQQERGIS